MYPTTLQYSCVDSKFSAVFATMAGDGGSDSVTAGTTGASSANDVVTYTAKLASASTKSWWSTAYVTGKVQWTIRVAEDATIAANNAPLVDDANNFVTITKNINDAFAAAVCGTCCL